MMLEVRCTAYTAMPSKEALQLGRWPAKPKGSTIAPACVSMVERYEAMCLLL